MCWVKAKVTFPEISNSYLLLSHHLKTLNGEWWCSFTLGTSASLKSFPLAEKSGQAQYYSGIMQLYKSQVPFTMCFSVSIGCSCGWLLTLSMPTHLPLGLRIAATPRLACIPHHLWGEQHLHPPCCLSAGPQSSLCHYIMDHLEMAIKSWHFTL